MNLPAKDNKNLKTILERINKHKRLAALWECSNIMAVNRLGYSDHGPVHVAIVSNLALKILRNLIQAGVVPSLVKDYQLTNYDAEMVVVLGSALHDIGNSIHRTEHDITNIPLSLPILDELLDGLYNPRGKQVLICEVLHTIISHDNEDVQALTVEAGVVRLADALDMKEGRARIPFQLGKKDIHAVSAMAIDDVRIGYSKEKPVQIKITMNNSAGIFQVDYLLKNRVKNSPIEKYISVTAEVKEGSEKKILTKYEMK